MFFINNFSVLFHALLSKDIHFHSTNAHIMQTHQLVLHPLLTSGYVVGGYDKSASKGFPFLDISKYIWDLNKVNNSHYCHGLKRVAQGLVSNGKE